jgi:hypothetical protein
VEKRKVKFIAEFIETDVRTAKATREGEKQDTNPTLIISKES